MKSMRLKLALLAGCLGVISQSSVNAYDLFFTSLQDSEDSAVWHENDRSLTPISLVGCDDCDGACDGGGFLNRFLGNDCGAGCDSYCGEGCDSSCDGGCDSLCGSESLFGHGIIKRGDKCFDDFISPMTNPVFFEDPRTLTEVRFIFLNHNLPGSLGGNSVQVYAAQVRVALTERLSLIATKDGLIYTQSPVLENGFADIAAGLKYNVYRDPVAGRLLSAGFTYEIPMGTEKSLQGNGDGELNFFLTGGTRIGDRSHWLSAGGLRQPIDENAENAIWYWSNHFDYRVGDRPIYLFTENNWYHYASSGDPGNVPVEGGDLFNLGAPGVTGNDLVTHAVGVKAIPKRNMEAGIAYEFPLTERKGLMQDRLTVDLIFRY